MRWNFSSCRRIAWSSWEARWRFRAAGALIIAAELGGADFARLDALRRRHYPPERNRVPAHLTLFRSLPPSAEAEVRRILARAASLPRPEAVQSGVMDLGGGVAVRIRSDDLDELRRDLAEQLHGLLTAQDIGGWIPHVTIQNKVDPKAARSLLRTLEREFQLRPLSIIGLQLVRYLGGQWDQLATYRFRGVSSPRRSRRS